MRVTVFGPNLPRRLADKGTIHLHKAGCRDIVTQGYPKAGADQGGWSIEIDTVADAVEAVYPSSDFDYDPQDPGQYAGYRDDIYVAPCVTVPPWPEVTETTVEILEPKDLDWHGHLLAAYQHLDAVLLDPGTPGDIVYVTDGPWRSVKRLLQAISDGEV